VDKHGVGASHLEAELADGSRNGSDSISPIVPPISTIWMSTPFETRRMHS
jgi:hypothetical protein